jgi:hypothetical protein
MDVLITTEAIRQPSGDVHTLPPLPFPACCTSATQTVPTAGLRDSNSVRFSTVHPRFLQHSPQDCLTYALGRCKECEDRRVQTMRHNFPIPQHKQLG